MIFLFIKWNFECFHEYLLLESFIRAIFVENCKHLYRVLLHMRMKNTIK